MQQVEQRSGDRRQGDRRTNFELDIIKGVFEDLGYKNIRNMPYGVTYTIGDDAHRVTTFARTNGILCVNSLSLMSDLELEAIDSMKDSGQDLPDFAVPKDLFGVRMTERPYFMQYNMGEVELGDAKYKFQAHTLEDLERVARYFKP